MANAPVNPINDIIEVKQFLVLCIKAGVQSGKDGKWDQNDIMYFGPAMMALVPAIQGIGDIGAELKVLPEHIDELVGSLPDDLGLSDTSDIRVYVGEGVKILQSVYKILKTAKKV